MIWWTVSLVFWRYMVFFFGLGLFGTSCWAAFFHFTSYLYFFLSFRFLSSHPSHFDLHSSPTLFYFAFFLFLFLYPPRLDLNSFIGAWSMTSTQDYKIGRCLAHWALVFLTSRFLFGFYFSGSPRSFFESSSLILDLDFLSILVSSLKEYHPIDLGTSSYTFDFFLFFFLALALDLGSTYV